MHPILFHYFPLTTSISFFAVIYNLVMNIFMYIGIISWD